MFFPELLKHSTLTIARVAFILKSLAGRLLPLSFQVSSLRMSEIHVAPVSWRTDIVDAPPIETFWVVGRGTGVIPGVMAIILSTITLNSRESPRGIAAVWVIVVPTFQVLS